MKQVVYLMRADGGHHKIGRSRDPDARTAQLDVLWFWTGAKVVHTIQTDSPDRLEQYLHRRFADKRVRGEWFRLDADDVAAILKIERMDLCDIPKVAHQRTPRPESNFPSLLRSLRETAGLTQYELARRAGVSKQAINHLEAGAREPMWETVQKLCLALQVGCEALRDEGMKVPGEQPPRPRGRPRKKEGS